MVGRSARKVTCSIPLFARFATMVRILCLHGSGASAAIMKSQIGQCKTPVIRRFNMEIADADGDQE